MFYYGAHFVSGKLLSEHDARMYHERRKQGAFQGNTWLSARICSANLGAL